MGNGVVRTQEPGGELTSKPAEAEEVEWGPSDVGSWPGILGRCVYTTMTSVTDFPELSCSLQVGTNIWCGG